MFVPLTRLGQAELEGSISISFRQVSVNQAGVSRRNIACNWFLLVF